MLWDMKGRDSGRNKVERKLSVKETEGGEREK